MIKLKDLLTEGKYEVYFDVGSPGLMSKTVDAKNAKEAAKKVASGLKGGAKLIKKVVKEGMNKRQAGEMLKQLGGNRFIMMTGAKNFGVGPKGAGFKIGRNSKGVNFVRIDLKNDLYNMEFIQLRKKRGSMDVNMKVLKRVKGVYADQLQSVFTKHTGMYTSLQEIIVIKLKKLIKEEMNPRRYSEIKGQAKYLAMEMKSLNKAIRTQNDKDVVDSIDYILGKAKMMKEILTDKRYD